MIKGYKMGRRPGPVLTDRTCGYYVFHAGSLRFDKDGEHSDQRQEAGVGVKHQRKCL